MIGFYEPGGYIYNTATQVLKQIIWVDWQRYFDGDEYAWSETPKFRIIRSKKEKEKVLQERPWLLTI